MQSRRVMFVGDARLSEGVGEAGKSNSKRVGDDGRSFERNEGVVRVELDEADEEVRTGGEATVPDDFVGGGLHNGCFDGGDGMFVEGCGHGMGEGGGCEGELRETVQKKVFLE